MQNVLLCLKAKEMRDICIQAINNIVNKPEYKINVPFTATPSAWVRVRFYIIHSTSKFYLTEGQNLDTMCQFTDRRIHE